jgi:hypothetical protein
MELSIRRAQAVADYLISKGVSPEVLRVQGCSTFEPVVERAYTPDVRAMNRRVEVEATSTIVTELQDPPRAEELGAKQHGGGATPTSATRGAGEH